MQNETNNMTVVLGEGYEEVKEGTEKIQTTGAAFENINSRVTEMAKKIDRIYDGLENMSVSGDSINNSIDNVAAILEESTAGIQEVSSNNTGTR